MKKLGITHIYHSGFRIDSEDKVIFIDVYNHLDSIKNIQGKRVYFFSTHSHKDHFNAEILKFSKSIESVKYILSDDIHVDGQKNIFFVKNGDYIVVDDLEIEVFGSTDLGVSFLIKIDGENVFHSGDLNWWHWEENSLESQLQEKADYQKEIEKLIGKNVDIAFVPVDPRLGDAKTFAMDYFIKKINPKVLIPMHFGSNYDVTNGLSTGGNTKIVSIKGCLTKIY